MGGVGNPGEKAALGPNALTMQRPDGHYCVKNIAIANCSNILE